MSLKIKLNCLRTMIRATGMGFLRVNDLQLAQNGEFKFGFWVFIKKKKWVLLVETESKTSKNIK